MAEQPSEAEVEEIKNALASGNKIAAIKIYRGATGKDLKAAKDFIDALVPRLIEQDPEKYVKLSAQGQGCGLAVFLFVVLAAVGVLFT